MSKIGKILFFFSGLAFVILGVCRLVYGGWHSSFWVPFGLMFVLFIAGVIHDRRAIREIFGMRATQHGMNMGALIATAIVGLGCLNFLAVRYEKKFDWTSDKLNSLSDQSIKAAQALKNETELVLLYGHKPPQGMDDGGNSPEQVQKTIQILADMYLNVSSKIKYTAYNALTRPDLAKKYEYSYGAFAFYVIQGERKVKIDPANEEAITRALLKLERDKKKIIYFTRGHGERQLDQKDERGLSTLKEDLSVTYEVKSFALFETKNTVPEDASAVAIIGPEQQFLEEELKALREYADRGGRLIVALDPDTKQNLSSFIKTLGIEFSNDYVFDPRSRVLNAAPQLVLGTDFASAHEITKAFKQDGQTIALFDRASSLKPASEAPATFKIEKLISTDASTGSVNEMKKGMVIQPNGPHTILMASTGKLGGKEFSLIVFGDSDFVANRLIQNNLNRDVVGNSFAYLASDSDLISIRPKEAKGTKLNMMNSDFVALILMLFAISLALFASGIGFWWRRRMA